MMSPMPAGATGDGIAFERLAYLKDEVGLGI